MINPAEREIGKIIKLLIENISIKVREKSFLNQWRETDTVITWFKYIKNKSKCVMQFDIEEFYPSISKYLLVKTINHARTFVDISSKEMHSRKFLLFNNAGRWIKKDGDEDFNVTMDSFDGAEICELMDLYILYTLGDKMERKLLLCMDMIA